MWCNSTLENANLRFKVIDLNSLELIFTRALISIIILLVHRSRTLQTCATASAHTTRELSNTETFLSASLLIVSATHLWSALGIYILLPGELWYRDASKSTREISCIDGLITDDSCIHFFKFIILNNHLLLLIVIEAFWKRRTLIATINLICSDFEHFKILGWTHNATIVRRNSTYWVHIAKLLRFSGISSIMHLRLRVWLRRLTALTLYRSEISTSTILQAYDGGIHLILMWTLFL